MRFIDEARIRVISGSGGNGIVSFRREKFVPFGGPDGGDGGRGGDVVIVATERRSTLQELRGRSLWKAQNGRPGGGREKTGASGASVEVPVPVGTRVIDDETGRVLADLVEDGQRWVAARGGRPGRGNAAFKSSTNRAPRRATPGQPGEDRWLRLELVLMADAGLVGFPNAGKSTFISRVSAARPRIADYPFTTLVPSLGVVDMGVDGSFVVADLPGLVRGAAEGAGLGHRFLRHVRRTRVLVHLVSLGPDEAEPPATRYRAIREELGAFDASLLERPEIVVLSKRDLVPDEAVAEAAEALRRAADPAVVAVLAASAATGVGMREVVLRTWDLVQGARA